MVEKAALVKRGDDQTVKIGGKFGQAGLRFGWKG